MCAALLKHCFKHRVGKQTEDRRSFDSGSRTGCDARWSIVIKYDDKYSVCVQFQTAGSVPDAWPNVGWDNLQFHYERMCFLMQSTTLTCFFFGGGRECAGIFLDHDLWLCWGHCCFLGNHTAMTRLHHSENKLKNICISVNIRGAETSTPCTTSSLQSHHYIYFL